MHLVSDELLNEAVLPEEVRVVAAALQAPHDGSLIHTVGSLADALCAKPLRVANVLLEHRGQDDRLKALVDQNEFLIKKLGSARLSAEVVAGDRRLLDKFWRNNDPLGVYKPGDMFYVDEHHKMMPFFPVLVLVPAAILALVPLAGLALKFIGKL